MSGQWLRRDELCSTVTLICCRSGSIVEFDAWDVTGVGSIDESLSEVDTEVVGDERFRTAGDFAVSTVVRVWLFSAESND